MNEAVPQPEMTLEQINYVLNAVALQIQTAMQLSVAMMLVLIMVAAFAFQWRKTGLLLSISWGVLTSTIHNGHAMIIGPAVVIIGIAGLVLALVSKPAPN